MKRTEFLIAIATRPLMKPITNRQTACQISSLCASRLPTLQVLLKNGWFLLDKDQPIQRSCQKVHWPWTRLFIAINYINAQFIELIWSYGGRGVDH